MFVKIVLIILLIDLIIYATYPFLSYIFQTYAKQGKVTKDLSYKFSQSLLANDGFNISVGATQIHYQQYHKKLVKLQEQLMRIKPSITPSKIRKNLVLLEDLESDFRKNERQIQILNDKKTLVYNYISLLEAKAIETDDKIYTDYAKVLSDKVVLDVLNAEELMKGIKKKLK